MLMQGFIYGSIIFIVKTGRMDICLFQKCGIPGPEVCRPAAESA